MKLESCPFCAGSGRRIAAPEPGQKGRINGVRRHGKESTYCLGCRCDGCRAAHRVNTMRRKMRARQGAS